LPKGHKETLFLTQDINEVPFDLRHLRLIVYSMTAVGIKKFEKDLTEYFKHYMETINT
jgi:hypothetical protein